MGACHDGSFLSVFFFKFVCAEFAVVYAFSAADAFFVVYFWVPWDFVSGDSVPCFFCHFATSVDLVSSFSP